MPSEDMGYLLVNIQLPDAASLQRSDAVVKKVEKIIEKHPEVEYVTAATGFSLISGSIAGADPFPPPLGRVNELSSVTPTTAASRRLVRFRLYPCTGSFIFLRHSGHSVVHMGYLC